MSTEPTYAQALHEQASHFYMDVVANAIRREGHDHDVMPFLLVASVMPDGTETRRIVGLSCGKADPSLVVERVLRELVPVQAAKAAFETGAKLRAVVVHSTAWIRSADLNGVARDDLTGYSPSALFDDGLSPRQAAAVQAAGVRSLASTTVIDSTGDLVGGGFVYDDSTGDHEPYERYSTFGDGRQTEALRGCMLACALLGACVEVAA